MNLAINFKVLFILASLTLGVSLAHSQEEVTSDKSAAVVQEPPAPVKELKDQELVDIEEIYKSSAPPPAAPPPIVKKSEQLSEAEKKEIEEIQNNSEVRNSKLKSVAELNKLSPFSDVSMIQKKYLPKTERFQIYTGLGLSTNSPWFLNLGGKINMSYNFTESFGLEASALYLSSTEKEVAKEIRENNSLQPERFILTKSHLGLDLLWSPLYGKITNLDQEIIPFDTYFSLGGGISGTNSTEKNVPTVHIATGQIYALSKSFAFRWDYSWYYYQATPTQDAISTSAPIKNAYNDLIFTAGISFFFPGVSYR